MCERLVFNTSVYDNPSLLSQASKLIGAQSMTVEIAALFNDSSSTYCVYSSCGKIKRDITLIDHLIQLQEVEFGELVIHSVSNDGMRSGLDCRLYEIARAYFPDKSIVIGGGVGCISQAQRDATALSMNGIILSSLFHESFVNYINQNIPAEN